METITKPLDPKTKPQPTHEKREGKKIELSAEGVEVADHIRNFYLAHGFNDCTIEAVVDASLRSYHRTVCELMTGGPVVAS